MSTPEIHITAETKPASKTVKRKKGAEKFQQSVRAKRTRSSDTSANPNIDEPAPHVQSFRYLFSFAHEAQNPSNHATLTVAQDDIDSEKIQLESETRAKEPHHAKELQVHGSGEKFSFLGVGDEESAADLDPARSKSGSKKFTPDSHLDIVNVGNSRPSAVEIASTEAPTELNRNSVDSVDYAVHGGLANDSEADILALAMSFCGVDVNPFEKISGLNA
jgi:hypothetical protein